MRIAVVLLLLPLAGCIEADVAEPEGIPVADALAVGTVKTWTAEGAIAYSVDVSSKVKRGSYTPVEPFTAPADVTGYVFEMTWTAKTDTAKRLALEFRKDSDDGSASPTIVGASGESPLRLVVPQDKIEAGARHGLRFAAAGPTGVALDQPVKVTLTEFAGAPMDPEYSAL